MTDTPTDLNCFPLVSMEYIGLWGGAQGIAKLCMHQQKGAINKRTLADDVYQTRQKEGCPRQSHAYLDQDPVSRDVLSTSQPMQQCKRTPPG